MCQIFVLKHFMAVTSILLRAYLRANILFDIRNINSLYSLQQRFYLHNDMF
jgi:hypothetical protein